jgi:tetratricopeptide (TPR) repeat protein
MPDRVPARGPFAPERLDEAIARLTELAERQPGNHEVFYQLGLAHLQRNDPVAAAVQLRRAAELRPDDPHTLYVLGITLADSGDGEGALAAWRHLLEIQPNDTTTRYMLGRLLAVIGRLGEAAAELSRALAEAPPDTPASLAGRVAEALGEVHLAQGDRSAALLAWRDGLKREPGNLVMLGNIAAALLDQGRYDEAITVAERAKRLGDKRPIMDYNLGIAHLARGDAAAAVRHLRGAAAASPDDNLIRVRLSAALASAGDRRAAWTELNAVLAKAPDDPEALTQAGALHLAEGSEAKAEEAWSRAGDHAPARSALAALAERRQQWSEADALWQGLAASDATNPLPWLRRAVIALRRGDPKSAAVLAGEALARAPQLPEAEAVLGLAEWRSGKGPDRLRQGNRRFVHELLTPEERRQL